MKIVKLKRRLARIRRDIKLYQYHLKRVSFKHVENKRIIICFNGVVPHGGFVDRLKGIISFYDIASQLGYDFFIQFNHPFKLSTFLEPQTVNHYIETNQVTFHVNDSVILNLVNDFNFKPETFFKNTSKKDFLVYSNVDYLPSMYPYLSLIELENKWRQHFNKLFKKSHLLETKLKDLVLGPYISIHTRFTGIMGDFTDSTNLLIPEESQENLLLVLKDRVNSILQKTDLPCFVFSDSRKFLNFISKETEVNILEGTPFHMDSFEVNNVIDVHLKTLIDFFMISGSEAVYFIKTPIMYKSAFSKYAAILGNKPFETLE
ncbi:hypothetical protein [Siansivirga zeaxanthinifaciens]|uniref:Uncharacterized protein n=1 Tax=Siansivirga zeaxanthinifaciens CC-SAMT-1 TaxID=1454006 RepID=A0A0C5WFD5_9FLAO|nr:hypothetical protein [Siansivirga zeaxanthinifaciens]AJR04912.1 hypothetical protein AW14_09355 [Siansivirga zeaxanthinifaciens CC-SAMT-1]